MKPKNETETSYCCCCNRCESPQSIKGRNETLGYFSLSNEKESWRRLMTPVALPLGHGHGGGWDGGMERMVVLYFRAVGVGIRHSVR